MSNGYPTSAFLDWLADRLENVYDESPNVDFVQRLRREAADARAIEEGVDSVEKTYHLRKTDSVFMTGQTGYVFAVDHVDGHRGVIGSEFRLTPQEAHDIGMALTFIGHKKHHGIHSH